MLDESDVLAESVEVPIEVVTPDSCGVVIRRVAQPVYRKMLQNLWLPADYGIVALLLAFGAFATWSVVLPIAVSAILMLISTVTVALNAQLLWPINPKSVRFDA